MYEICRLLAPKKTPKPRKPAIPAIAVGKMATLTITGETVQIIARDTRCKNAWFVQDATGRQSPYSFARDCLKVHY